MSGGIRRLTNIQSLKNIREYAEILGYPVKVFSKHAEAIAENPQQLIGIADTFLNEFPEFITPITLERMND